MLDGSANLIARHLHYFPVPSPQEALYLGEAKTRASCYMRIFGCKEVAFPFKYLRIPISQNRFANRDWNQIEERIQKKLSCWKGKLLSTGGRLVPINSILSSLPLYTVSFFKIPKGILRKLDYYRSRIYWQ
jgi:hypothetical protein